MRVFIMVLTVMIISDIYGQTDSTERVLFRKKLEKNEVSRWDYSFLLRKWEEKIKADKYPELPLNSDGKIQYSYIMEFDSISKGKLFNRILEWLAITYGIVPTYLYSNAEDGKIICSNSMNIQTEVTGSYALVFTIADGKVLLDFANIGYYVKSGGYYSGETWIPERNDFNSIDKVYPILSKDISSWGFYFKVLKTIDNHFNNDIKNVNDFIVNYDVRYQ